MENVAALLAQRKQWMIERGKKNKSLAIPHYRGVKGGSPFERLKYYNIVKGMPPCLLHDFLEGVCKTDLPSLINLAAKDLTIEASSINNLLHKIKRESNETLAKFDFKNLSIEGSGMMVYHLLKYLVVVFEPYARFDSSAYGMVTLLHKMGLVLMAPRINF